MTAGAIKSDCQTNGNPLSDNECRSVDRLGFAAVHGTKSSPNTKWRNNSGVSNFFLSTAIIWIAGIHRFRSKRHGTVKKSDIHATGMKTAGRNNTVRPVTIRTGGTVWRKNRAKTGIVGATAHMPLSIESPGTCTKDKGTVSRINRLFTQLRIPAK